MIGCEAGDNLNLIAEIVARSDVSDDSVSVLHHANLQLLASKDQRTGWKKEGKIPRRDFQMDLRIGSRKQRPPRISEVDLRQQSPSRGVNCLRCAHQPSSEPLAGKFGEGDVRSRL